ncbi:MAG TPA: hypothetical protein VF331_27310 [Polyangiales bacterium]
MSGRAARQVFALGLALLGWAVVGQPSLPWLLVCYAAALGLLGLPSAQRLLAAGTPAQLLGLSLLMAAPGVSFAWRSRCELAEAESLHGLWSHGADRLRLQLTPAIAPPLVTADRPQSFFVYAPGATRADLQLGQAVKPLTGQALGEGLFRVDYDPRRDGKPQPTDGTLHATVTTDRERVTRELRSVTPLAHPRWLALSPDGLRAAAVSSETDELIVIARGAPLRRIPVHDGPSDCVFLDDSHVAVSHEHGTALDLVALDATAGPTRTELERGQLHLALDPQRSLLAVALAGDPGSVVLVDAHTLQIQQRIVLDSPPDWLAFGPDDGTLIVSTRAPASLRRLRRSPSGYVQDASLPLRRPAVTLARSFDGSQLFFAATDYDPGAGSQLGNHFVQDQVLTLEVASMRVSARLLTARRSARQSKPGDQDRGASPMGLFHGADGALLIAFAGSDEVWRLARGASDPEIVDLASWPLHAPHGVTQLTDGTMVVSSPSQGTLGLLPPDAREPTTLRLTPDDAALLASNRAAIQRRVGERGFYEATRSGISCQSCHMHGDSDEAAYNLGDHRLIPTLGVRGLLQTSPYLRDGSYPQLADLDDVAQTLYRGYLRSQRARGETLQAYIEALPRRHNTSQPRDLTRERRGLRAFFAAHCPSCHAPPAFTNLGKLPMQLLFPDEAAHLPESEPLDTPSLLSVGASAPYLNDGRARTLQEVLGKHNARNLHGDTRSLSAEERADLVFFLGSL